MNMTKNDLTDYLQYTWIFDAQVETADEKSTAEPPPQSQGGNGGGEYPSRAHKCP